MRYKAHEVSCMSHGKITCNQNQKYNASQWYKHAILHCLSFVSFFELVFVFCWCFFLPLFLFFIWIHFSTPSRSLHSCNIREFGFKWHSICLWDLLKYSFYTFWMCTLNEYSVTFFFFFAFCFCINKLHCHRIIMLRMLPFYYVPDLAVIFMYFSIKITLTQMPNAK